MPKENVWFALHTRHQHELKVTQMLKNKGFETFLPTCRIVNHWSDRNKVVSLALFPGYLFASQILGRRHEVLSTPGVATIVSVAGVPAEIPEEEIDAIRRAVESRSGVEPHPYLSAGDEVRVRSGPLAGIRGILIRRKDLFRLVVCIEILGRAASLEIDALNVEPVGPEVRNRSTAVYTSTNGTSTGEGRSSSRTDARDRSSKPQNASRGLN